jgi:ribonuclease G
MNVITTEKCPTCNGSGEINASSLIIDTIEEKMQFIVQHLNLKNIKIIAHPFVAAYLKKGVPSMRHKWILKYKTLIKVAADTSFHLGEYHFQNASGEDIIME